MPSAVKHSRALALAVLVLLALAEATTPHDPELCPGTVHEETCTYRTNLARPPTPTAKDCGYAVVSAFCPAGLRVTEAAAAAARARACESMIGLGHSRARAVWRELEDYVCAV